MLEKDLELLVRKLQRVGTELNYVEVKEAHAGCPHKLYDTISAFSNLEGGGIIVFGLREAENFAAVGVYDAADLQKRVTEQCKQMEPVVRALFTCGEIDGHIVLAAEIPELDISEKPCFYIGKGRLRGSYIRVGDSDEPMSEYEVYSYEAFRKKYQDDVREVQGATRGMLAPARLGRYMEQLQEKKPQIASLAGDEVAELMRITAKDKPTLLGLLLFGKYPQSLLPQLSINAVVLAGRRLGDVGEQGERFIDNKRIDGTLPEMLEAAVAFVKRNMSVKTVIAAATGRRQDAFEYPVVAVRELILNALVHRDYSLHTEGKPIQLTMYQDRLEVVSPGGLYGRIKLGDLGRVQPDTRNPALAVMLEDMGVTENRYSGIPTVYRAMQEAGLPEPEFVDNRDSFKAVLRNGQGNIGGDADEADRLVRYCAKPRSRKEIADFLQVNTVTYAITRYVVPLVREGRLEMTIPEQPKSRSQQYIAVPEK